MDSHVEYDPEFSQGQAAVEQKSPGKPSASERVLAWRKKNPDKYRAYQKQYMKTYRKSASPKLVEQ